MFGDGTFSDGTFLEWDISRAGPFVCAPVKNTIFTYVCGITAIFKQGNPEVPSTPRRNITYVQGIP
jgi:hypothetical protein